MPGFTDEATMRLKNSRSPSEAPERTKNEIQQQQKHMPVPQLQQTPLGVPPWASANPVAAMQQMEALRQMAEASGVDLVTQATMLQMGQVAQAHVAEAVRLQAMAAGLQAQVAVGGLSSSHANPNSAQIQHSSFRVPEGTGLSPGLGQEVGSCGVFPRTMGPAAGRGTGDAPASVGGLSRVSSANGKPRQKNFAPAEVSEAAAVAALPLSDRSDSHVMVKRTFIHVRDEGASPPRVLRQVRTASAALCSLAGDGGSSTGGDSPQPQMVKDLFGMLPSACGRDVGTTSPSEPVLIHTGTLRSMSCNALDKLATEDPERMIEPTNLIDTRSHDQHWSNNSEIQMRVKKTFLEFEAPEPQGKPRLRPVHSASGRLDALANEDGPPSPCMERPPLDPFNCIRTAVAASSPEKRSQDTPLPTLLATKHRRSHVKPEEKDEPAWLSPLGSVGVNIKHTFLEFAVDPPPAPLRVVRTAGGRLDLMGQE